ncbi:MAG: hypothetical protein HZC41_22435 [Chloroflexi bacterium]|nr:hypothetical protein [Chloroflexota bacterium]
MSEIEPENERSQMADPITRSLNRILEQKAARPQDVYRLAVIVEALLDSQNDPGAIQTIRGELRALLNDLSQSMPDSSTRS